MNTLRICFTVLVFSLVTAYRVSGCGGFDLANQQDSTSIEIPVVQLRKLIFIKGEANGQEGYFLFDTGTPELVMNEACFQEYYSERDAFTSTVDGQLEALKGTRISQLSIGPLPLPHVRAVLADLSNLEQLFGIRILGLLGVEPFLKYAVSIDLSASKMILQHTAHRKRNRSNSKNDPDACVTTLPFQVRNNVIILESRIGKKKAFLGFDTGAETTLIHNGMMKKLATQVIISGQKLLVGAGKRIPKRLFGTLSQLDIGLKLENIEVLFTDLGNLKLAYDVALDGLIGHDLLQLGKVIIDFPGREIRILDNACCDAI